MQIVRVSFIVVLTICTFFLQSYLPLYSNSIGIISGVFCSNGLAQCNGNLTPTCSNTEFIPKCLSGGLSIECCMDNGSSLDCRQDLSISCSVQSSSGYVSNIVNIPFCSTGMIFCTSGVTASCLNSAYSLTCLSGTDGGFPDCCRRVGSSLDCKNDLLSCSASNVSTDRFKVITINVVSNPTLPTVVDLPLVLDDLMGRVGYAYSGSNPSFEIKLPTSNPDIAILSVDIKDKNNFIFNKVLFTVTEIQDNPEKLILNLNLPDSISKGEARFVLNLSDGSTYTGAIEIIDPLNIQVFKGNGIDTEIVSKPKISNIKIHKSHSEIIFELKGKNFVGQKIFLDKNGETTFIESAPDNPNTFVTIFPTKLNLELIKRVVSSKKTSMRIRFKSPLPLEESTNGILVISTPRGIISKQFKLNPKSKQKAEGIKVGIENIICFMGKPACPDGKHAFCSNSSFSPRCLPASPFALPDCCKGQVRTSFKGTDSMSLNCNPSLLECPAI